MAYQINNIVLICIISAIFGITINSELNCWMGFSMGGQSFGDDDEFGPLFDMNCSGKSVNCMSTNCVLDEKTEMSARFHSCSRDAAAWCRAHKIHCKKMFNGTMSKCSGCTENLCNAENYTKVAIPDKLVVGTAVGGRSFVLFWHGVLLSSKEQKNLANSFIDHFASFFLAFCFDIFVFVNEIDSICF